MYYNFGVKLWYTDFIIFTFWVVSISTV